MTDISQPVAERNRSPETRNIPLLSPTRLTWMLGLMVMIPIVTLTAMEIFLPAVYEGKLECRMATVGLPEPAYYETRYDLREPVTGGELLVTNLSDQEWTHLNMQVNQRYQLYDIEPIPPQSTRSFRLESFISRSGARFSIQYNELKTARIYARRPTRDRATYTCDFKDGKVVEPPAVEELVK